MANELVPCGTLSAVTRHRRRKEPLDDACRQAESDYQREYYRSQNPNPNPRGRPRVYQDPVKFWLLTDKSTKEALKEIADGSGKSLNSLINEILTQYIEQQ